MAVFEHRLEGCPPQPLASYLKALGIFRLVAGQADSQALGFWRDERFVLRTTLDEAALLTFFFERYAPSPIISPWNAGSGFYRQEGKKNEKDPTTGKKLKTGVRDQETAATKMLASIAAGSAERFAALRCAIEAVVANLVEGRIDAAPSDAKKQALIARMRATLGDDALPWLDAAVALTTGDVVFPPLLGSGGNDGNFDFSGNLHQSLADLFDLNTGKPLQKTQPLLEAALLGRVGGGARASAIGQLAAGASGGVNAGIGFEGKAAGNPWDLLLSIEGSLMLAGAASRRLGVRDVDGGSFPFMTPFGAAYSAGAGAIGLADEATARGEFWAPLWIRPAGLSEVAALFREGRAVVQRRNARTSLDFARAIAQIGSSRGLEAFDRHAFQKRNGNMFLGVALPRHPVPARPVDDLVADLDQGGWLRDLRRALLNQGAAMAGLCRQLDETLFRLAADTSQGTVQAALIAIGEAVMACSRRPKLRIALKAAQRPPTAPPPLLGSAWYIRADDGSAEFRLAAALAGLTASVAGDDTSLPMPFRSHLAPVNLAPDRRRESWIETTASRALLVWHGRDVLRDLGSVLERRLVEAQRHVFMVKGAQVLPLIGAPTAPLWAVAAFLAGRTDDQRIAQLAQGLAWVDCASARGALAPPRLHSLPFAYAAIMPLLDPLGVDAPGERRRVDPLSLIRLVMARRVTGAVALAQRMARGAGLEAPFARMAVAALDDAARLAAALVFPLSPGGFRAVSQRAYPTMPQLSVQEEANNAA
ncbi:MAG: type I-U CRISPR-associated protein Csx17 [Acetobacteraceae bacterium]|nr:type I-U CRISPR-associated protein Csx17 [Acetobacteraceae bacterium]